MIKNIKAITDKKLAPFCGVAEDAKTFRNWKIKKGQMLVPYAGKHNLYKGAKLYYYLCAIEEDENSSNAEILNSAIEGLESKLEVDTSNLTEDIKESIQRGIKEDIEVIKHISKEILFN